MMAPCAERSGRLAAPLLVTLGSTATAQSHPAALADMGVPL